MPFIGQQPITGAYHVLDAITASATATYNLQLSSVAFSPATANQLIVSLNGVIQKPGSSFTVSGSTITFSSALTSSDNIDFIMALGDVLNIGTPTDGTVSAAKIASSAVTDAKLASTLDLSGKTVTYGLTNTDLPAGTVLQTVFNGNGTAISTTNSNIFDIVSVNITPVYQNSKFIITSFIQGVQAGTNTNARFTPRNYRDATQIWISNANFWTVSRNHDLRHGGWGYQVYDTPNTTSQITYKLSGQFDDPSSPSNVNKDSNSGESSIMVMEIKQ